MTKQIAGKLAECPFFIDSEGKTSKYVCADCGMETDADRESFLEQRAKSGKCKRAKKEAKSSPPKAQDEDEPKTTTSKKKETD